MLFCVSLCVCIGGGDRGVKCEVKTWKDRGRIQTPQRIKSVHHGKVRHLSASQNQNIKPKLLAKWQASCKWLKIPLMFGKSHRETEMIWTGCILWSLLTLILQLLSEPNYRIQEPEGESCLSSSPTCCHGNTTIPTLLRAIISNWLFLCLSSQLRRKFYVGCRSWRKRHWNLGPPTLPVTVENEGVSSAPFCCNLCEKVSSDSWVSLVK